ncbi:hypothetical protein VBD025_12625 [Virgibacillus flavescens]
MTAASRSRSWTEKEKRRRLFRSGRISKRPKTPGIGVYVSIAYDGSF